jgi:hypothetical protein
LGLVRGNSGFALEVGFPPKGDVTQVEMTRGKEVVCGSLLYRMEETIVVERDVQATLGLRVLEPAFLDEGTEAASSWRNYRNSNSITMS